MTKLCLNLCCDDDAEECQQSLPQVLSLHPQMTGDVAGSILLKEDGHLRLCDDLVFRVSDAYFIVPGVERDIGGQIGAPRLILDTDVDPVLGRLFSKYSDVVKLHKISISGGNLRCSVKLVFSEVGSLARVLCFVRDVLKLGTCDVGGQHGVPRRASGLAQDLLDACYDFFCSYITFYAFRVVDAVRLVTSDKDHQWDVDTRFFTRSIDGRSLLYDEASSRVLTFLHEHRAVVRSMESRSNERFVAAVLKSIAALANDVMNHVLSDRSVAEHSYRNLVAAYSAGRVGLAESVVSCINRGGIASSSALVREAIEILAIFYGFTGNVNAHDAAVPSALVGDLDRLSKHYARLSTFIRYGLVDLHKRLAASVYDQKGCAPVLSCGAEGNTALDSIGERYGPVFAGVFVRYEKLCWIGFFPVEQARGIRALLGQWNNKPVWMKKRFAEFCLADFVLYNIASIGLESDVTVSLPKVGLNNRIHRAVVLNIGEDVLLDSCGWRKFAVVGPVPGNVCAITDARGVDARSGVFKGDGHCVNEEEGMVTVGSVKGDRTRRLPMRVALGYSILALSIAGVVCGTALWASWSYHMTNPLVLLAITIALYIVIGVVAEVALGIIGQNYNTQVVEEDAELYTCVRLKNDKLYAVANNSEDPADFSFNGDGQLCINSSPVPRDEYEVTLFERGDSSAVSAVGNCILLGMMPSCNRGLELLKTLVNFSMPGLSFRGTEGGSSVLTVQYTVDLSSSRDCNLRLAEVLGRTGDNKLLLAYIDSYVSAAFRGSDRKIDEKFTSSRKWKLLCQDQFRWSIVDHIVESCGAQLLGNREKFVEFAKEMWAQQPLTARRTNGLFEGLASKIFSVGFPFDTSGYRGVAQYVPGFSIEGGKCKYMAKFEFTYATVHFVRDGEYLPPGHLNMCYDDEPSMPVCSSIEAVCDVEEQSSAERGNGQNRKCC